MDILFFNRSFYPDTEATGQFLTELCEDLISYGHSVTVVAGHSYHVNNKGISLIKNETYKSISIIRAYGTTFPKRLLLFRLINLGTYFLIAFICGFFVKKKPDVIIALTDPPVLGLLGILFSRFYKAKFIYSCKDIYPEVGIITGRLRNPFLNFLLEKINKISFVIADNILCLGEDMKKRIVDKGISSEKISVIHDWADTNKLYPIIRDKNPFVKKYDLKDKFIIMYSGNIGLTQDLDRIIEVAEQFKDNKELQFLLIGEGADKERLQKLVIDRSLTNIIFLPYQPKEELKYSLSAASIHLITSQQGLVGVMVQSKIYGILACGRPFIAWVDKGSEIDLIANRFKCGFSVLPGDVKGMVETIELAISVPHQLDEMGTNGRKAVIDYFDRKISSKKFIEELLIVRGS